MTTQKRILVDREGYILAIRTWWASRGHQGSLKLRSRVQYTFEWPYGEPFKANCWRPDWAWRYPTAARLPYHDTPPRFEQFDCGCGIYGVSDAEMLKDLPAGVVWGYVALWGRVRTAWDTYGNREWRAQYAYPQALRRPSSLPEMRQTRFPWASQYYSHTGIFEPDDAAVERLAEAYGVPVIDEWIWETGAKL